MEQGYTVGVHNKFAAFDEDIEDPYDIIKNVEAEKLKKKALKVTVSNDNNKENKSKDANEVKAKPAKKLPPKTDRAPPSTGPAKPEQNNVERSERANNRRNKEDDFPRTGNFREGKPEGGAPRGPRNDNRDRDGPRERRDGPREPRPFRGDGERDRERRPPRGDGESRGPYRPRDGPGSDGENRPPRRERREYGGGPAGEGSDFEGRPERRGPGARGRGARPPGRNADNRGKREFDRRSGSDRTGVKPVDKRDGAGSYNWDSAKDPEAFIPDMNETNVSDEPEWDSPNKETDGVPAPAETENAEPEDPPAPVEEEPQELTLDEYRKLKAKREGPQFNIRKPGEGEDLSQWKNMVEIKKKENVEEEDEEFDYSDCPQRAGRQKHVVGIDITFGDAMRGGRGRGRGGRGGGGGGRDRDRDRDRDNRDRGEREPRGERRFPPREREDRRGDRDREDRNRPSAPKVDDEKAFPSLG